MHSFVESDDRVALVMNFLDEAITEVDAMDSLISSYKIHLNVRPCHQTGCITH